MVCKRIGRTGLEFLAMKKPAGDDPDTVPEQGRVGRFMDVCFYRSGVDPDLPTDLDFSCKVVLTRYLPVGIRTKARKERESAR
jgi:hypothetical protein